MSVNDLNSSTIVGRSAPLVCPPSYGAVFGIELAVTIIGAAAAVIWMQRNDAIAAYQTATSNLGNGMSQQTGRRAKVSPAQSTCVRMPPSTVTRSG